MKQHSVSRRQFLFGGGLVSSCWTAGCGAPTNGLDAQRDRVHGPPVVTKTTLRPGIHSLGLRTTRDGVLSLPLNASEGQLPLIVLCHGAGGSGADFLRHLRSATESLGAAILAPDSDGSTWDLVQPESRTVLDIVDVFTGTRRFVGFGPDVAFMNRALEHVGRNVAVDPARVAIAGFSDGATYALSLGLINGDVFRRIVAFSPGFVVAAHRRGRPDVFISHGRGDTILPIARTTRRIAPDLRGSGYALTVREFEGGHELPDDVTREALAWAIV